LEQRRTIRRCDCRPQPHRVIDPSFDAVHIATAPQPTPIWTTKRKGRESFHSSRPASYKEHARTAIQTWAARWRRAGKYDRGDLLLAKDTRCRLAPARSRSHRPRAVEQGRPDQARRHYLSGLDRSGKHRDAARVSPSVRSIFGGWEEAGEKIRPPSSLCPTIRRHSPSARWLLRPRAQRRGHRVALKRALLLDPTYPGHPPASGAARSDSEIT